MNPENIVIIDEIKKFIDELTNRKNGRYRSWDHCRRVFRRAAYNRNSNNHTLPKLPDCECATCGDDCAKTNCRLCNNNLALNLMAYLASWGMYRGSSFLPEYDYTIHIGAVKILMDKKYLPLFDPNLCITNTQQYIDLAAEVFCEIWDYYEIFANDIHTAMGTPKHVSDTLVTKILMGVYGCMPAYDRYFKSGIAAYGGTANVNKKNIKDVLGELAKIAKALAPQITPILSSAIISWDKCALYTPMKIIDMTFWEIGKAIENNNSKSKMNSQLV